MTVKVVEEVAVTAAVIDTMTAGAVAVMMTGGVVVDVIMMIGGVVVAVTMMTAGEAVMIMIAVTATNSSHDEFLRKRCLENSRRQSLMYVVYNILSRMATIVCTWVCQYSWYHHPYIVSGLAAPFPF